MRQGVPQIWFLVALMVVWHAVPAQALSVCGCGSHGSHDRGGEPVSGLVERAGGCGSCCSEATGGPVESPDRDTEDDGHRGCTCPMPCCKMISPVFAPVPTLRVVPMRPVPPALLVIDDDPVSESADDELCRPPRV